MSLAGGVYLPRCFAASEMVIWYKTILTKEPAFPLPEISHFRLNTFRRQKALHAFFSLRRHTDFSTLNRSLHVKFLTQWFTNRFTSIFLNSYLVPRLGGIKQNKCIIHCWPSRWFLLLYFPKPGSQVWILIFRNLSILTFNSENQIFIRGKAPELKKHIYISVLLLFRSK